MTCIPSKPCGDCPYCDARTDDADQSAATDLHAAGDREPSHLDRLRAALVDSAGLYDIPDPDPLIGDDILYRDCLAWMVGKPGSMKSFTALDIAACVATGEPWQTYPVRQGPVLFLVAEGVRGTKKRVRAWEKSMGRTMTSVHFLPMAVQSRNRAQWNAFVDLARELRPALIVIDTQARVTVGVEENSNTDMGEFVHQAEQLRTASGACVLIVHHIGRNGDTGRGATVLDGAVGTIIKVTKVDDSVSLECTKNKDGTEWPTITLRAVPVADSVVLVLDDGTGQRGGASGTSPSNGAIKTAHTWWAHHRHDTVNKSMLVDIVATKSTLFRHIRELDEAGWVHIDRTGKYPQYRLVRMP